MKLRGKLFDMSISKLLIALKGGSGSGNFGHFGRPGKRGGSASGNSLSTTFVVNNYLGVDIQPSVEVLDAVDFDDLFGSPDDAIHGGVAAIRTDDGIFIKRGYESDGLHELVHEAGFLEHGINAFLNEGITQAATESMAKQAGLSVRNTYDREVATVRQYILPAVGVPEREFYRGYARANDKADYIAKLVWNKHQIELSDSDEWGKFNTVHDLKNEIATMLGYAPRLAYVTGKQ